MNQFNATLISIDSIENLTYLSCKLRERAIEMLSLEINESIHIGDTLELSVKSTNISIAKNLSGALSHANQLPAKIRSINKGKILGSVHLEVEDFTLEAILTCKAIERMNLELNDDVIALIKASEISIVCY